MTEGQEDNYSPRIRRERARNNVTALSIFYGFIFVFSNALTTAAIYISENHPECCLVFYLLLILLGIAQATMGTGLHLEATKLKISKALSNGLLVFVIAAPLFYVLVLGAILGFSGIETILGTVVYGIGGGILVLLSKER